MFSKLLNLNVIKNSFNKVSLRKYSQSLTNTEQNPGRVVFISQSNDVYSNLAIEDWLYKNWNFSKRHILLLWRNSPCVVIGRHQNPFAEANVAYLDTAGVPVIRRNSGGGTVYHDDGNLNCTFFTSREMYNRRRNLDLICNTLNVDFNICAQVNSKDDIIVGNDCKISGTAAKLGLASAYHHCTLLVSTDKLQLKLALKGDKTLKSKATKSVCSTVTNLQDVVPELTVEKLLGTVGQNFLNQRFTDTGVSDEMSSLQSDGFTLINPTEDWFPGLDAIKENLKSWNWFIGMTPFFKQVRPITIDHSLSEGSAVLVAIEVFHGMVKSIKVESTVGPVLRDYIEKNIGNTLIGTRYSSDMFMDIESRLLESELKPQYSTVH